MRQKQIDESRNLILDGFFSVLQNKQYSKISMSEIAERSTLTRMTLYRHFKNKDELLKYLIMNIIKDIKTNFAQLEHKTLANLIRVRFLVISKNKYLKAALSNKEVEPIVREFISQGRFMFTNRSKYDRKRNKYMFNFIIGGMEKITKKWLLEGMKESPDTITKETINILKSINIDVEVLV